MQLHNDKITTLQTAIQTAYLDHTINSNLAYRPEFISNNYKLGKKVLVSIEEELQRCEEFFIRCRFYYQERNYATSSDFKRSGTKKYSGENPDDKLSYVQ